MQKYIIIAIDGPAASGKSSVAKRLADKLGFLYVDTGAMYRAITYLALEKGIENDEKAIINSLNSIELSLKYNNGITRVFLNGEELTEKIRTPRVSAKVSDISTIKEVREELVRLQRKMGENTNLVVEGRDTTTVVFPKADIKIFLTADVNERAKRRLLEFKQKGVDISLEEVAENIKNRDKIDSGRDISPLSKAKDAFELNTTHLTVEEEIDKILNEVKKITNIKNK